MVRLPVAELKASPQIREFIKGFEDLRLTPYCCSSGAPTIGWGHTKGVSLDDPPAVIEQAEAWFDADVAEVEAWLRQYVRRPLTQGEWDALISFGFNVGSGGPGVKDGLVWLARRNGGRPVHSTLLTLVNQGRYLDAGKQFPLWANGRDPKTGARIKLKGLVKRRAAEWLIWVGDSAGYKVRP